MAKFIKGVSGNPAGRPRGSRSKFTKYKRMAASHVPAIIEKLCLLAKDGDIQAAKVVLDRSWPVHGEEVEAMEKLITELTERVEQLQLRQVA